MALREVGANVDPELSTPRDLCHECVWSIAAGESYVRLVVFPMTDVVVLERIYAQDHYDHIESYDAASKLTPNDNDDWVWISKTWLNGALPLLLPTIAR